MIIRKSSAMRLLCLFIIAAFMTAANAAPAEAFLGNLLGGIGSALSGGIGKMASGFGSVIKNVMAPVSGLASGGLGGIFGPIVSGIGNMLGGSTSSMASQPSSGVQASAASGATQSPSGSTGGLGGFFGNLLGGFQNMFSGAGGKLGGFLSGLSSLFGGGQTASIPQATSTQTSSPIAFNTAPQGTGATQTPNIFSSIFGGLSGNNQTAGSATASTVNPLGNLLGGLFGGTGSGNTAGSSAPASFGFSNPASTSSASGSGGRILGGIQSLMSLSSSQLNYPAATQNGRLGCAYVVSLALQKAGYNVYDLSVNGLQSKLQSMGFTQVPMAQRQAGDVIIWNPSHIGVVAGGGRAVSNSSSAGQVREHSDTYMSVRMVLRPPA